MNLHPASCSSLKGDRPTHHPPDKFHLLVVLQVDVVAKSLVEKALECSRLGLQLLALVLDALDLLVLLQLSCGQQFLGLREIMRNKNFANQIRNLFILVKELDLFAGLLQGLQLVLFHLQVVVEIL